MKANKIIERLKDILQGNVNFSEASKLPDKMTGLMRLNKTCPKYTLEGEQLTGLNLAGTGLTDMQWKAILQIPEFEPDQLQALNLSNNKLETLDIPDRFAQLQQLEISGNEGLKTLTFSAGLPNLERLILRDNNIQKLEFPEGFAKLHYLDASRNEMGEVSFAEVLATLEFLNLSENLLTKVIFPKGFTNLKYLYLFKNKPLTKLRFGSAPRQLEVLHLDYCALEELPHNLISFNGLQTLYLHENPLPDIPKATRKGEEAENSCEDIMNYLREYSKGTRVNERVKIILVGNGRVGKTSMFRRLKGQPFREAEKFTHGVKLGELDKRQLPDVITPELQANVWDFGGQEIFYATHQFFLTEEALYILAWTDEANVMAYRERDKAELPQDKKFQSVEYWLENIRHHGGEQCPVLMVQTHYDQKITAINAKDYLDDYEIISLNFSACTDEGLSVLKQNITNCINNKIPFFGKDYPITYDNVMGAIERLDPSINKITREYFEDEICKSAGITPGAETTVLDFLRKTGTVVWFKGIKLLEETIFVKPNWLTKQVYRLINNELEALEGEMDEQYIKSWLPDFGEKEREQFIELLKNFRLIFQPQNQEGIFITPQYLPKSLTGKPRKALAFIEANLAHIFSFHFPKFLPDNVIVNFLCQYGPFSNDLYWKNGICFKNEFGQDCKVELDGNSLHVFTKDDKSHYALQAEICHAFVTLSKRANAEISLDGCRVSWQKLNEARKNNINKILDCSGQYVAVSHFDRFFIRGIKEPLPPPPPESNTPKIYFSYAWKDKDNSGRELLVSEIFDELKASGFNLQRDKENCGYGEYIDEFMKKIGEGNLIVVFLSEKYFRSLYCMSELFLIAQKNGWQKEGFRNRILPIMVEPIKFDLAFKERILKYWKENKKRYKKYKKNYGGDMLGTEEVEEADRFIELSGKVSKLINWLSNLNRGSLALYQKDNFAMIKEKIAERLSDVSDSNTSEEIKQLLDALSSLHQKLKDQHE